jgi:hypothetical protein
VGLAKRWQQEQIERGWFSEPDLWVCADCIEEEALADLVRSTATHSVCSYCGRRASRPIAAELDVVSEAISDGLTVEYGNPSSEGVPWEKGWALGGVVDTWDLLWDFGVTGSDGVLSDLVDAFDNAEWCQRSFYRLAPHKALRYSWQGFVASLRGEVEVADDPDLIPPHDVLGQVEEIVHSAGVKRTLREGTILYRARAHAGPIPMTAAELGPPPAAHALDGRMSRKGDPVLYGAYDSDTTLAEVAEPGDSGTVARFRLLRDLAVVDLADIVVPSLFDREGRSARSARLFLHGFAADISQPAASEGDYEPTQRVTYRLREDTDVDGIIYRSAKNTGGACVTLFCDASRVGPPFASEAWLALDGHETFRI